MAPEIERKWVLGADPPNRVLAEGGEPIRQGYLARDGGVEVRVRNAGERFSLTVKGGEGLRRSEVEREIGPAEFEELWALTRGRRIEKRRYRFGEPSIELDVYASTLSGLVTAEVEFDSEVEAAGFVPPPWLGREVTGRPEWSNARLAVDGLPSGPEMTDEDPRQYRFRGDERLDAAARRAAAGRAEHALEQLREADRPDSDAEHRAKAVHETRKDLKKARSVLRLVRDGLGKQRYREQNSRLRDAAHLLAGARDAEVKLATLDSLLTAEGGTGAISPDALARLREGLESERTHHSEGDSIGERIETARETIEAGRLEIAGWELPGDWKAISAGLDRSYRRGQARYAEVQHDTSTDEAVHEWRKRVKDLWYHLRLLRDAWEGVLAATVDELDELSDLLGDHHDLSVLVAEIERRMPPPDGDAARLIGLARRRQEELLTAAFPVADRVYAERPRQFVARVRTYWEAWGAEEEQEPEGWAG